jgi:hypothetical protein
VISPDISRRSGVGGHGSRLHNLWMSQSQFNYNQIFLIESLTSSISSFAGSVSVSKGRSSKDFGKNCNGQSDQEHADIAALWDMTTLFSRFSCCCTPI